MRAEKLARRIQAGSIYINKMIASDPRLPFGGIKKIGIGREEWMPAEDYVLRKFRREELAVMKEAIQKAADVIYSIITEGVHKTMNRYN